MSNVRCSCHWSHSFHCSWIPARPVFWAEVAPWAAGCYRGIALSNSDPSCPDSSTVSSLPSIHSILSHGKTLQGNCGTNISTFYSNFPIVKYWDLICISHIVKQTISWNNFSREIQVFLGRPTRKFPKKVCCEFPNIRVLCPAAFTFVSRLYKKKKKKSTNSYWNLYASSITLWYSETWSPCISNYSSSFIEFHFAAHFWIV